MTWLPTLLLCLVVLALIRSRGERVAPHRSAPIDGVTRWVPRGGGSVEFLGEEQRLELLRQLGGDRFRIEFADGTAFEAPRLDRVVELCLRDRLAVVRAGESATIRFWLGSVSTGARPSELERHALTWAFTFVEELKDGETWYRAPLRTTGMPLYARTVEELKGKIQREIARDVVALHAGELGS